MSGTDKPFDRCDADRVAVPLNVPVPGTTAGTGVKCADVERVGGDEYPHDGCPATEQSGAVGVGCVAEQFGEGVGGKLFGAAVV